MPNCCAILISDTSAAVTGIEPMHAADATTNNNSSLTVRMINPPLVDRVTACYVFSLTQAVRHSSLIIHRSSFHASGSRAHPAFVFGPDAGRKLTLHRIDKAAQIGPRIARVDHVLDCERLGSHDRRRKPAQLGFDFLYAQGGVASRHDFAPAGGETPSCAGQRPPFGGRRRRC